MALKSTVKGKKIIYEPKQEATKGKPILAAFGGECQTPCPHLPKIKVGSASCDQCNYNGGKERFATSTGDVSYGGTREHRKIYCKRIK